MGADGLTGSPGLSVAWFFIPIAFLFMPFVVMRDTWKASASPRDWQGQPTDPLLGFWWAAMLVTHLAASSSFRLWLSDDYDVTRRDRGARPDLERRRASSPICSASR